MTAYKPNTPPQSYNSNSRPCTPPPRTASEGRPYLDLETPPSTPASAIQGPMDWTTTPGSPAVSHKRIVSLEPQDAEYLFLPITDNSNENVNAFSLPSLQQQPNSSLKARIPAPRKRVYNKRTRPAPGRILRRNMQTNRPSQVQNQRTSVPAPAVVEEEDSASLNYRSSNGEDDGVYQSEHPQEKRWPSPANVTVPLRRNVSYHALSA